MRRRPAAGLLLGMIMSGCVSEKGALPAESLGRFEFAEPQMGIPFRIVLYAANTNQARAAADAAFARISELNEILSDYDTDSELSRLSQTSGHHQAIKVSPDLWRVLERAQALAAESEGAFDITAGPYISRWRRARRTKQMPQPESMNLARQAVGYQKLVLDPKPRTAWLKVPYMRLDLGGIAKGYALDEALKILRQHGIRSALVAGGGDMAAGDAPPGKPGWRIEIASLPETNAPPSRFVWLNHAGLATSGDLFQFVQIGGVRYSHIVDPRTGIGLTNQSLVTVIAPDAMTADSMATTVSVLGPETGLELIEAKAGLAAYIVRRHDQVIGVFASERLKKYLAKN